MRVPVGFLLGLVVSFVITMKTFESDINAGNQANRLTEECQQELPRTEHCTIIAVPEKDVEE